MKATTIAFATMLAIAIVFFILNVSWFSAAIAAALLLVSFKLMDSIYTIPKGKYGISKDTILLPQEEYLLGSKPTLYTPAQIISTIGKNIIEWDLDPENLLIYHRLGEQPEREVEHKFKELLSANPAIDLRDFEKPLGIKIIRQSGKTEDPKIEGTVVGTNDGGTVTIRPESRNQHILVIGKTGTGKSTLMLNMIRQDMEQGRGLAVVEPGDLVRDLLRYIPANRQSDVLYYDFEHPLPIDVFETSSDEERETLAEDIITTFKRFFESSQWGMGMDTILRFTVLALGKYPQATFLDIYKFLADDTFRAQVLGSNSNPTISHFWQKEFPKNPTFKSSVTGINSRMAKFVTSKVLQNTLGTKRNAIDFQDLLQRKKILLVNLRGGEAGSVIGSLIVSKIQQTAMRRKENRIPFYLYADEFQNYTTSAFNVIFTEARKYELGMTLATQLLSNVPTSIRDNILQAGTAITFKSDEGNVFKNRLGDFEPKDVATLPEYSILVMGIRWTGIVKTLSPPPPAGPPFTPKKPTPPEEGSAGFRMRIVEDKPSPAAPEFDETIRPEVD